MSFYRIERGWIMNEFNIKDKKDREKLLCETAYYTTTMGYLNRRKYLYIPVSYITQGGFELGKIWDELQELYNQNQLSEEEIRFLIKLKMQFLDSPQKDLEIWMDRADEAEAYYKEHGTLSMSNTTVFSDGASMFQWVHHQKKLYKQGILSLYQQKRLESMGIHWIKPKKKAGWNMGYQHAEDFYNENGHLFVDRGYIAADGFELGEWIHKQRDRYLGLSSYTLSDDRIEMLEDIGMFWEDLKNAEWDWFVGLLRECIRVTEKPFILGRNYRYKNYALGEQVSKVISQYADGSLSEEKEKDLRNAGFKFNKIIK